MTGVQTCALPIFFPRRFSISKGAPYPPRYQVSDFYLGHVPECPLSVVFPGSLSYVLRGALLLLFPFWNHIPYFSGGS